MLAAEDPSQAPSPEWFYILLVWYGWAIFRKCWGPNLWPCQLGKTCWRDSIQTYKSLLFSLLPVFKSTKRIKQEMRSPQVCNTNMEVWFGSKKFLIWARHSDPVYFHVNYSREECLGEKNTSKIHLLRIRSVNTIFQCCEKGKVR